MVSFSSLLILLSTAGTFLRWTISILIIALIFLLYFILEPHASHLTIFFYYLKLRMWWTYRHCLQAIKILWNLDSSFVERTLEAYLFVFIIWDNTKTCTSLKLKKRYTGKRDGNKCHMTSNFRCKNEFVVFVIFKYNFVVDIISNNFIFHVKNDNSIFAPKFSS